MFSRLLSAAPGKTHLLPPLRILLAQRRFF
jgi:hypothetical protein